MIRDFEQLHCPQDGTLDALPVHWISVGLCHIRNCAFRDYGEVIMGIGFWLVVGGDTRLCVRVLVCSTYIKLGILCDAIHYCVFGFDCQQYIIFTYARKTSAGAISFLFQKFTLGNCSSTRLNSEIEVVVDGYEHHYAHDNDSSSCSTVTQPEPKYVFTGKREDDDEDCHSNTNSSINSTTCAMISKDQAKRLRLVSVAILFVISYVICHVWTGIIGYLGGRRDALEDVLVFLVKSDPIFVLQAIFSALQGKLSLLIWESLAP